MKIYRGGSSQIGKSGPPSSPTARRKEPAPESKKQGADDVVLSFRAAKAKKLTKLAELAPDVRLDKIAAIRRQIKAGTYNVPADLVARSIADLHRKLKTDDK